LACTGPAVPAHAGVTLDEADNDGSWTDAGDPLPWVDFAHPLAAQTNTTTYTTRRRIATTPRRSRIVNLPQNRGGMDYEE